MKVNDSFEDIWNKLKKSKRVILSLHYGPDCDSLGSCLAMKYVLERDLGLKVDIVSKDFMDKSSMEMSVVKEVRFGKDISDLDLREYGAVVLLDSGNKEMVYGRGKDSFSLPKDVFVINIDHHDTNTFYGNMNYVIKRCSCCSILLDLFKEHGIKIDAELANRLLLGVCTDSGFFQYSNASEAINDASFLIEKGANYQKTIVTNLLSKKPLNSLKFEGLVIDNLEYDKEKKLGYSIISFDKIKNLGLSVSDVRFGSNLIQNIEEFDFVFTLIEVEDSIKGSFRSSKGIDVSLFAKELGGGGHKPAAGFNLKDMTLEEAREKVFDVIKKTGIHKY